MRELILSFAVRGKLFAEHARAYANGDIADDLPCALPHGWRWIRLSDLGQIRGGKTPSTQRTDYWNGSVPWITPKDMKQLRLSDSQDHVTNRALEDGLALIPPGSLLVVVRSGILRRTVPVAINDVETTINQDLKALVFADRELAPYVQLLIRGFEAFILERLTKVGTTVESIQFDAFVSQPFPLPPKDEQARIVARVDELMRLCDALEEKGRLEAEQHARLLSSLLGTLTNSATPEELAANWQRVAEHFDLLLDRPEAVDAVEQTVIQLAIRGSLVPQDQREEPAWKSAERLNCENSVGVRQKRRAKNASSPDGGDELGPLPAGWARIPLGTVVNVLNGRAYSKSELLDAGPTPVLRVGNLFTSRHWYYSDLELDAEKYCEPGDLLYAWSASFGPVIWSGPRAIFHYHIWKLQPVCKSDFNIDFFYLFLLGKTAEIKAAGHGVAMTHMTKEKMEAIAVPYPPLAEQGRIVARVKELRSLCATLRQRLQGQQAKQSRLAEALVEQALAG